jgi:hypothetical protein
MKIFYDGQKWLEVLSIEDSGRSCMVGKERIPQEGDVAFVALSSPGWRSNLVRNFSVTRPLGVVVIKSKRSTE